MELRTQPGPTFEDLLPSWQRHLRARGRSPRVSEGAHLATQWSEVVRQQRCSSLPDALMPGHHDTTDRAGERPDEGAYEGSGHPWIVHVPTVFRHLLSCPEEA